jgi:hypothetical protein
MVLMEYSIIDLFVPLEIGGFFLVFFIDILIHNAIYYLLSKGIKIET